MSGWWVQTVYDNGGPVRLFSWVFWVIASITLHELAHGIVAIRNGDNTPRELGHMTLNPIVHMGMMSLIMFAVCGVAWGLMPTRPDRYRRYRLGVFTVAIAGPVMNLLLAAICLLGGGVWLWLVLSKRVDASPNVAVNTADFLWFGGFINLLLFTLNMLPVPPLDGSRILGALFPDIERFFDRPEVRMYGMIVVLVLFFSVISEPLQRKMNDATSDITLRTTAYLMRLDGMDPARIPSIGEPD